MVMGKLYPCIKYKHYLEHTSFNSVHANNQDLRAGRYTNGIKLDGMSTS